MNDSKISVRYSRAIFEAALEKNVLDNVNTDMVFIAEACKAPAMKEFLENPVIRPSKKKEIFNSIFGKELQPLTMSLIDLLVSNGRESFLPAIARVFMHETRKYKGITEAVLTTAVKVDPAVKEQVSALVSRVFSTGVELKEVVNPDIIGGFMLRVDDSFIDASVRNKLRKVRKELLESIKMR
jgi:F-type H+-transporting ATPase subunit delta